MGPSVYAGLGLLVLSGIVVALTTMGGGRDRAGDLSADPGTVLSRSPGLRGIFEVLSSRMDAHLAGAERQRKLSQALENAGSALRSGEWATMVVLAVIGALIVGLVFSGFVGGFLAAVATWLIFRWRLKRGVEKRRELFAEQLPESLQIMAGSLRSGMSLLQSMETLSKESQSPSAEEFKRVMAENRLGRDLNESMRDMAERLESEDFVWVVGAVEINREVGGDLAEILDRVGNTVRQRERVRGQARALSAEGRMSGYTLLALPPIAFVAIGFTNPSYVELMTGTVPGVLLLFVTILMMLIGTVWMRSLIKAEL